MTTNFKDDDNLLVNRDGTDYRASAERLKSYVRERLPEEDPVTGQWFHIRNVRGGNLKIKTEGAQVQCVDVIGQAPSYAWYDKVGAYHYGHSIRLYATFEPPIEGNAWGDMGDLAREIYGDDDGSTVEGLISELGYDKDNFFGTYWDNSYDTGREDAEFLEILPTTKVNGNGVEVPNNFEYLVYVPDFYNLGQRLFRADPGCTYEIGPLTNTASMTNWRGFFDGEENFVPNLKNLDTSGGTNFKKMFYQTNMGFRLDLRDLNVGNGQKFEKMFEDSTFDADISTWDMSSATNMEAMFNKAKNFTCGGQDIGQWQPNTNALYKTRLFYQNFKHELDVTNWVNSNPEMTKVSNDWNEGCLLRMKDGTLVAKSSGAMNNEPWTVSISYPYNAYWSALRLTRNPIFGPTGELSTARKELWQGYVDWVDAKVEDGTYEDWKKVKDQAAKDEFQSYKDADTILVNGGPEDPETGLPDPAPKLP